MSIDWTKPLRTKGGDPARLIGDLLANTYCKVAAVGKPGFETVETYTIDGAYNLNGDHPHLDLENVPPDPVQELLDAVAALEKAWTDSFDELEVCVTGALDETINATIKVARKLKENRS